MKVITSNNQHTVLRFFRGEELVSVFLDYLSEKNISSGWIQGLGAGDEIEYSYYDLKNKKYVKTVLKEEFEITSLQGNIALTDGKVMIHAHINISKKDMNTLGGHLHSVKISGTGEILLTHFKTSFTRELDSETGLKLLK
mgnify:CR=1 FL=1